MDESIIWIILLLIIYVANFFLKKKGGEGPVSPGEGEEGQYNPQRRRPRSPFEELFGDVESEHYEEEQEPVGETYERSGEAHPVYETLENAGYQEYQQRDDAEIQSIYDKSVAQAGRFKTLDEQVKIEDVIIKKQAEPKSHHRVSVSRYASMLQNPQSAKDAIVLAEILNRKYD